MSKVWFCPTHDTTKIPALQEGVVNLFEAASQKGELVSSDEFVALKIHFGEKNNTGYIKPVYLQKLVSRLKDSGCRPFFTDTNTLYSGQRSNSVDHLMQAHRHGFSPGETGIPVIIADGILSQNHIPVEVPGHHFQEVSIASDIYHSDALFALSHLTGHLATCLGATIKNLAMGCASRSGKQQQHADFEPDISAANCTACGLCAAWCPVGAIKIDKTAVVDYDLCYGCAECLAACQFDAISVSWAGSNRALQEKMAEYALGAVKNKLGKVLFFNFLIYITKDCDCMAQAQDRIIDDIGILASTDPVAVDQAAVDLLNDKTDQDFLKETWKESDLDYRHQLNHAEEIGLGSRKYQLIEI